MQIILLIVQDYFFEHGSIKML